MMAATLLLLCCCQTDSVAPSESSFTLVTQIHIDQAAPRTNITLFLPDRVIDFDPTEPHQITVFEFTATQVVLYDLNAKQRSSIPNRELGRLAVEVEAGLSAAQRAAFGLDAPITDHGNGTLVMQGQDWSYEVKGQAPSDALVAQRYAAFASLAAQLNILERQGPPPFARIRLNQELASRDLIPQILWRKSGTTIRVDHELQAGIPAAHQQVIQQLVDRGPQCAEVPRALLR